MMAYFQKPPGTSNCVLNPTLVNRQLRIERPPTMRYSGEHVELGLDTSLLKELGVEKRAVPPWINTCRLIVDWR